MRVHAWTVLVASILVASSSVQAQASSTDSTASRACVPGRSAEPETRSNRYTLFHPTPDSLMRELNTDRPNATESPYTVDAGHGQIELSFLEYSSGSSHGESSHGISVLPVNLKMGITDRLDLQLVLMPYQRVVSRMNGAPETVSSGFGDVELRTKINFWGNNGGTTAAGIMPFLRFPGGTGGERVGRLEGGLILPFAASLPAGFGVGTMAEFDFNRNAANDGYGVDFVHSIALSHAVGTPALSAYLEYAGVSPVATGSAYSAFVNTGALLMLARNLQVDAGISVGLPRSGRESTVFSGISGRF